MGRIPVLVLGMFAVVLSLRQATCDMEMQRAKIEFDFASSLAHGLHSLTLEDVLYYFESDATTYVNIPTVNPNLDVKGLGRVLRFAPKNGYDTNFETIAMRHTDKVLSRMNNENWVVKYYSVLERLVHATHMAEMWSKARRYYNDFKKSGVRKELCGCLKDIDNNGVMAELQLLALKIKYPGITSGKFDLDSFNHTERYGYKLSYSLSYSLSFTLQSLKKNHPKKYKELMQSRKKLIHFDFSENEEKVVKRVARQFVDYDEGLTEHLTSEEGWDHWKKGFHDMGKDTTSDRTFGMFMYCMLNDGQKW